MVQDAITLSLRIGVGATRFGLRVAARGLTAAEQLLEALVPQAPDRWEAAAPPPPDAAPGAAPPPRPPAGHPPPAPAPAPHPAPAHVSRDARLVEESADPGAEDGAGAAVRIAEPWKGYGHMAADDVIARVTGASREEVAAVALYERAHRGRRTVLAAADRELRRASAG